MRTLRPARHRPLLALLSLAFALGSQLAAAPANASEAPLQPIDTSGFRDSAHHWREIRDESRFIRVEPGQPSLPPERVRGIVANILLFQRANGGWPKDYDMTAMLTPEQATAVERTRAAEDTSFDNGNIHSQVAYLARAVAQTGDPAWRTACERGLDFILASQYPNGGWPQRFPRPKSFHAHITFNDFVTVGNLHVLQDAASDSPPFAWLDSVRRRRAADAVRRGVACILRCQIRVGGQLTGWCQQHDERTYEARPGRTFELASICPQDTTEIVRFLLRCEEPSPGMIEAVDAAVAWLRKVALQGVRVDRVAAGREEFQRHTADFDKVVVADPQAPPLWARHYEIGTDRPVFAGRDGVKKYALAEIERERRTGTPWYGTWPQRLLDRDYPAWRGRHAADAGAATPLKNPPTP